MDQSADRRGGLRRSNVLWFSSAKNYRIPRAEAVCPRRRQIWVGVVGVALMLEASRRALGPALTIVGGIFLA